MIVTLLFATLCLVLVWLYMRWIKVRNYWSMRNIPYVPPNPLMGNLTFLQRQNPSIWMRELYDNFKTPYIGVWLFWRPAIIINSPELAKQILIKDAANFKNKFMKASTTDPLGSLSILFLKDPARTNARRHLNAAFTSAKLKSVQKIANLKCLDLLRRIDRDKDKEISLRTMFADYTTDIFSISSFEIASNATLTGEGVVRSITKDLMKFNLYRGISWASIFFWPEIADLFRLPFLSRKSQHSLRYIFKYILERKRNEPRKEPRSLLDVLMLLKENSVKENEVISDDFIIAQAAILLIGGFDTSATTLTFIVYQLAFSPDIQEKLYKELSTAKQKHGENMDNIISESPYIECVIKEVLRMFPSMSWLDRVALLDYKVDDNLTIEAGMPVYVNGVGMHTDSEYFPDPYKFDPDRFLPENEARLIPYTYFPFGAGPRVCIGQRFAMITLRCAIAAITLNYRVEPYPNTPKPLEVEIDKRGIFLFPGEDLKVKFVTRN